MRKILSLLAFLTFISFSLNAQNDYNKTDKQGHRQGKWMDFHHNGNVKYIGEFKNNEPSGEFKYFSEGGSLVAKGKYNGKNKHEKWEFYSEQNGALILVENYDNGVLVGTTIAFSPVTNQIIEETEYVDGVKNGIYNKYYDNGRPMIKAFYKDDKLDGEYVSYYPNGVAKEEGLYCEGAKVGEWKTYDLEENVISIDTYK